MGHRDLITDHELYLDSPCPSSARCISIARSTLISLLWVLGMRDLPFLGEGKRQLMTVSTRQRLRDPMIIAAQYGSFHICSTYVQLRWQDAVRVLIAVLPEHLPVVLALP